jgi:hypothetical protein
VTLTRARVRLITAGVLLGGLAVAAAVYLRTMCRPGYVPQIDVPLWRGTDLPDPDAWPLPVDPAPDPADDLPPGLPGAILGLAYAHTEAEARGWLQTCADRGATWALQRDLWATWQQEHRPNVIHLDPPEDQP